MASQGSPWWQADLGLRADIESVVLFNRTDCSAERLSDITVLVSDCLFSDRTRSELEIDPEIKRFNIEGALGRETTMGTNADDRSVRV